MGKNTIQILKDYGQSVWYDFISRDVLFNGELYRLISSESIQGLTSNPTIFDLALKNSKAYDGQIWTIRSKQLSVEQAFEEIALQDIAAAADLMLPVYEKTQGLDGFVSIEVSPLIATDAKATVSEAKRIFTAINRQNIMIKIPGTKEGLGAVAEVLEQGINVNITLLFSVENYIQVAEAYCKALRCRVSKGLPVNSIRSVASFFVSRVDTLFDVELEKIISLEPDNVRASKAKSLLGKFGVANSKLAYEEFKKIFLGERFSDLRALGAQVQRPLWASTGMKNPNYRDVLYVEELIGEHTVNTMPPALINAFIEHGKVGNTLSEGLEDSKKVLESLKDLGINVEALLQHLQDDGVKKFSDSFYSLNKTLASRLSV